MRRGTKIGRWVGLVMGLAVGLAVLAWGPGARAASGELVGDGIARFLAEGVDLAELPPSFSMLATPAGLGPLPADWEVAPSFEVSAGRYSAVIETGPEVDLYGTGEIAGPLRRNGFVTETWNNGAAAYTDRTKNLYQSHPWVLAVRPDGSAFGVLADTSYRLTIDLRGGIRFSSAGHAFPVYIFAGATPQAVMKKLASLIGTIPMPPKWALGYHQCRYSYYPEARAKEIADQFRARSLPCDVIWFDIHYMDGYRVFTFDPKRYPDPRRMNDYLHERGFKSVWMIDPGVKKDPGYFVYDQGTEGDHWVLDKRGREYHARVWPGTCAFPDYTRPETRDWWAGLYQDYMATGIDGVWNDMNEPSFIQLPTTMPTTNLHRGGGDLPAGDHELYHNVYGMLMVKASRQGILAANPDQRPFLLSRSNFIGGQRYAAAWSGDILSDWNNLRWSVTMILNLGLSGQPFSGPDVGGFILPGSPSMFGRWFGVGAFFPFMRGHADSTNVDKEPWEFGPEVEASCKTSLERRYRLLPYAYTLFHEAAVDGLPVMRPVFYADPTDPELRGEDEAFLLGADLLVLPQLQKRGGSRHRVPAGTWRSVTLIGEDELKDINQPELRLRPGSIVPLGRVIQNTTEESLSPLTLLVSLDESGRAEGRLYEDAGDGFGYQSGEYLLTTFAAVARGGAVTVRIADQDGSMARPHRRVVVELVTDQGVIKAEGEETRPIVIEVR